MRKLLQLPPSRRQVERDLDDELRLHLELRADALVRQGLAPADARAEAEQQFGSTDRVRAECLDIGEQNRRTWSRRTVLDEVRQDALIAWRSLGRERSFALVAILVLALGIGATTAIFSLANAVLWRPLAGADTGRAMWITTTNADGSEGISPAVMFAWQDGAKGFDRLAAVQSREATLLGAGDPARLEGGEVGDGFLATMGVTASPGRGFQAADYGPGHPPVVLISRSLWVERFGADPAAVGRAIDLDGTMHTIVGVLPTDLPGIGAPQFLVPGTLAERWRANLTPFLQGIGRLRLGVTPAAAQGELQRLLEAGAAQAGVALEGRRAHVVPLVDHLTAPFRDRVLLLFGAVALVLLIGCVNVTNLLIARGTGRSHELALRASLGASRGRLIRQLLTENALLALVGGAAGVGLAAWLVRALIAILPATLPRLAEVRLDGASLGFALALTMATVLAAGLVPALRGARQDLGGMLKDGGRGSSAGARSDRLRRGFVVLEVALSTVMLVAAGLLVRSAQALGGVPPGFAVDRVVTARYALGGPAYGTPSAVVSTHERILTTLRERLGPAVALSSTIPLGNGSGGSDFLVVGGSATRPGGVNAQLRFVSPGYLRTMGITLLAGRDLDASDGATATRRLLVSESLARRLGIDGVAIGQRIAGTSSPFRDSTGAPYPWEVIGVVRDPRDGGLRSDVVPQVFIPLPQAPAEVFDWSAREVHVVWAATGAPDGGLSEVAAGVRQVDPRLPLYDVRSMRDRLRDTVALERTNTALLAALGVVVLVLAVTGLYGVVSYGVRQREREFGVRMALGATPPAIVGMVMRGGAWLTLAGLALGLPAAVLTGRALRSLLYGVAPHDGRTLAGTVGLLVLATLGSSAVPAWRASRVPPDAALRS